MCGKQKQQIFLYTSWILSQVCLLKLLSEEIIFICFASDTDTELDIYIYTDSQSDLYQDLRRNLLTSSSHSHCYPIQCNPFFATLQHNLHTTLFVPLWYWKILQTGFFSKSVYTEEDDVIILRMPVSDTESEYLEKFQVIKRWTGSKKTAASNIFNITYWIVRLRAITLLQLLKYPITFLLMSCWQDAGAPQIMKIVPMSRVCGGGQVES